MHAGDEDEIHLFSVWRDAYALATSMRIPGAAVYEVRPYPSGGSGQSAGEGGVGPIVEVRRVPDGSARLMVNGYGCASWPWEGPDGDADGYALEVARCLRKALAAKPSTGRADWPLVTDGASAPKQGEGDGKTRVDVSDLVGRSPAPLAEREAPGVGPIVEDSRRDAGAEAPQAVTSTSAEEAWPDVWVAREGQAWPAMAFGRPVEGTARETVIRYVDARKLATLEEEVGRLRAELEKTNRRAAEMHRRAQQTEGALEHMPRLYAAIETQVRRAYAGKRQTIGSLARRLRAIRDALRSSGVPLHVDGHEGDKSYTEGREDVLLARLVAQRDAAEKRAAEAIKMLDDYRVGTAGHGSLGVAYVALDWMKHSDRAHGTLASMLARHFERFPHESTTAERAAHAATRATKARLREALMVLRGWDMLDACSDGPWAKSLIDAALSPAPLAEEAGKPETRTEGKSDG